jgi:predicted RNA polymerase sigma factor
MIKEGLSIVNNTQGVMKITLYLTSGTNGNNLSGNQCSGSQLKRHTRFYTAVALTLNALILTTSTAVQAQFVPPSVPAVELLEQLDAPLNNGIQGEERNQADLLMRLGGQAQAQGNYEKAIATGYRHSTFISELMTLKVRV